MEKSMTKRLFVRVAYILIAIFIFSGTSHADPGKLMAEALKLNQSISGDLTIKDKLERYKNISSKLDEIVERYPGSEISIKLLSNQSIGNFNPAKIQNDYISLLSEYYDTVCEASPCYNCLGFVSLKNGIIGCAEANNFNSLKAAHKNLSNSIKIFSSQEKGKNYIDLATMAYRSCVSKSNVKSNDWMDDYFSSELIDIYLKNGEKIKARALIESMSNPYFKFSGALSFKKYSQETPDRKYVERLLKYADKKMDKDSLDKFLSEFTLMNFFIKHGSEKISFNDFRNAYGLTYNYKYKADDDIDKFIAELMMDYQINAYMLPKDRKGFNKFQQSQILPQVGKYHKGHRNWGTIIQLHGILLDRNGIEDAKKFRTLSLKIKDDEEALLDLFVSMTITTKDKAIWAESGWKADEGLVAMSNSAFVEILKNPKAKYSIFKKLVDFGLVCESTKILFQDLKGKKKYQDAVKYIIESPNIDPNIKYTCGDEDLELLLN